MKVSQTRLPRSSADSFLKNIQKRTAQSEAKKAEQQAEGETEEESGVSRVVEIENAKVPDTANVEIAPETVLEPEQSIVTEEGSADETATSKVSATEPQALPLRKQKASSKAKQAAKEELVSRTVRLYPSQIRALKRLALEEGPDQDKLISEIFRKAVDMYLAKYLAK